MATKRGLPLGRNLGRWGAYAYSGRRALAFFEGETFVLAAAALGAASGVVDRGCCWGGVDRLLPRRPNLVQSGRRYGPAALRRIPARSRAWRARPGCSRPMARCSSDLPLPLRHPQRGGGGVRAGGDGLGALRGAELLRGGIWRRASPRRVVPRRADGAEKPVLGDRGDRRAGAVGVHRPACLAAALPAACDGLINPFAAEICAGRTADRRRDRIRGQGTADSSGTRVYQRPNSSALVSLFHVVDAGCKSPVCLARRTSGGPPSRPRHEQRLVPLVWRRRWLITCPRLKSVPAAWCRRACLRRAAAEAAAPRRAPRSYRASAVCGSQVTMAGKTVTSATATSIRKRRAGCSGHLEDALAGQPLQHEQVEATGGVICAISTPAREDAEPDQVEAVP